MLTLSSSPKIGDVVQGYTVTEVRGGRVFGTKCSLPQATIDELTAHFAKPEPRGFCFRPGNCFATVK